MINIREFLGLGYYTSGLDEFLKEFDKKNPRHSASQRKEIEKYRRVFNLRDHVQARHQAATFWENF